MLWLFLQILWTRGNLGFSQGNGYRLINYRQDLVHVIKARRMIIAPTIVEFHRKGNFIAGLRLPISLFSCYKSSSIKILNEKRYFILNTLNNELLDFKNQSEFEKNILNIEEFNTTSFDYAKFDTVWNKFSRMDKFDDEDTSNCEISYMDIILKNKKEIPFYLGHNIKYVNN